MPRFIAVVDLSPVAHADLIGPRQRFAVAQRYLAHRGITVHTTFRLDGTQHLLVLDSAVSPTRNLNRALARAWPAPGEPRAGGPAGPGGPPRRPGPAATTAAASTAPRACAAPS